LQKSMGQHLNVEFNHNYSKMLENKSNDVEMGLLNDSTQNLHESAQNVENLAATVHEHEDHSACEFNVYKDIKSSPRKFYCKRFFI